MFLTVPSRTWPFSILEMMTFFCFLLFNVNLNLVAYGEIRIVTELVHRYYAVGFIPDAHQNFFFIFGNNFSFNHLMLLDVVDGLGINFFEAGLFGNVVGILLF